MLRFDDLFNEFFNKKRMQANPLHEELKKLIETISVFKNIENEKKLEEEIDKELGKPTSIETRIDEGILYKKLTWVTPHGKFVKIIVTDAEEETKIATKSLEEQLNEAIELEDYELAIKLRDKITPKKTTKKRTKK